MKRLSPFVTVALIVSALISGYASPANAGHNSCTLLNVQNPHWSQGSNGVITKSQARCEENVKSVLAVLDLFFCGDQFPRKDKDWLTRNCDLYQNNDFTIDSPAAGETWTRYTPSLGFSGVRRTGNYIAYAVWSFTDGHDGSDRTEVIRDFSNQRRCRVATESCTTI
jgi:hypothetical protein